MKVKPVSFRVYEFEEELLKKIGGENISEGVRVVIEWAKRRGERIEKEKELRLKTLNIRVDEDIREYVEGLAGGNISYAMRQLLERYKRNIFE